jgi:hypothetical protein
MVKKSAATKAPSQLNLYLFATLIGTLMGTIGVYNPWRDSEVLVHGNWRDGSHRMFPLGGCGCVVGEMATAQGRCKWRCGGCGRSGTGLLGVDL